jgi:hypothetical protein
MPPKPLVHLCLNIRDIRPHPEVVKSARKRRLVILAANAGNPRGQDLLITVYVENLKENRLETVPIDLVSAGRSRAGH